MLLNCITMRARVCCSNVWLYTPHNILFTLCEILFRWFLSIKKKRKSKRALTLDSLCTWQELFSTTKNNRLLNTMLSQMLCKKRAWARLCLVLGYLTWRHNHTGLLDEKVRQQLVDDHFLFVSGDRNLIVSNMRNVRKNLRLTSFPS